MGILMMVCFLLLSSGQAGEKPPVIPPELEMAAKTTFAQGKRYFLWTVVKPEVIQFDMTMVTFEINYAAAPNTSPAPFVTIARILARDENGTSIECTSTVGGSKEAKVAGTHRVGAGCRQARLKGTGEVTVYFVEGELTTAGEVAVAKRPDGTQGPAISNTIRVAVEVP